MTNQVESNIIRAVVELLQPVCENVFFGKSQVIYPKVNCDLRCFGEENYRARYRLSLDYYAANGDPNTVVTMSENVRSALNDTMCEDPNGAVITFRKSSGGGFVEEKDNEKIVHYMDAYEINFYKNQSF